MKTTNDGLEVLVKKKEAKMSIENAEDLLGEQGEKINLASQ